MWLYWRQDPAPDSLPILGDQDQAGSDFDEGEDAEEEDDEPDDEDCLMNILMQVLASDEASADQLEALSGALGSDGDHATAKMVPMAADHEPTAADYEQQGSTYSVGLAAESVPTAADQHQQEGLTQEGLAAAQMLEDEGSDDAVEMLEAAVSSMEMQGIFKTLLLQS